MSLTQDELRNAYKLRSKLVHAEHFLYGLVDTVPLVEQPNLYLKLEKLLRLTLKECFLNPVFYTTILPTPTLYGNTGLCLES